MATVADSKIKVPHFVRGMVVWGEDREYQSRDFGVPFVTPALTMNELFPPRSEPGPAFDLPIRDIVDFLVEASSRLELSKNAYLQESLEMTLKVSPLPRRVVENTFSRPWFVNREALLYRLEKTFGDLALLDGWVENNDPFGSTSRIRAFPPRLVHMLAGNSPTACLMSIIDPAILASKASSSYVGPLPCVTRASENSSASSSACRAAVLARNRASFHSLSAR